MVEFVSIIATHLGDISKMNQNPELLIEEHAELMADKMLKAAKSAGSEEDIRHAVNNLIDDFIDKAKLDIKGKHEYGLAGGRIDSRYGGVVIEYKDPKGSGKIIENKNAPGVKAVVEQIKKRFRDLQTEEKVDMQRLLGVGCDGDTFVFVKMSGNKFDIEDPVPVKPHTVERFLRAMISVGARGLSFTPKNLAELFGSESPDACKSIQLIYELIHDTKSEKAKTFFQQWQILFGEVCGFDIHGQSSKIKILAKHYSISDPSPADILFAVHTYYAIFIKLLSAEIATTFASKISASPIKKIATAPTSGKLKMELSNIEQGGIWTQLGIQNFLEGDLFSWYLDAWDERIEKAIRI